MLYHSETTWLSWDIVIQTITSEPYSIIFSLLKSRDYYWSRILPGDAVIGMFVGLWSQSRRENFPLISNFYSFFASKYSFFQVSSNIKICICLLFYSQFPYTSLIIYNFWRPFTPHETSSAGFAVIDIYVLHWCSV